jgi:hypothetical protein
MQGANDEGPEGKGEVLVEDARVLDFEGGVF